MSLSIKRRSSDKKKSSSQAFSPVGGGGRGNSEGSSVSGGPSASQVGAHVDEFQHVSSVLSQFADFLGFNKPSWPSSLGQTISKAIHNELQVLSLTGAGQVSSSVSGVGDVGVDGCRWEGQGVAVGCPQNVRSWTDIGLL